RTSPGADVQRGAYVVECFVDSPTQARIRGLQTTGAAYLPLAWRSALLVERRMRCEYAVKWRDVQTRLSGPCRPPTRLLYSAIRGAPDVHDARRELCSCNERQARAH